MITIIKIAFSLLPVFLFLAVLIFLDSYKLLKFTSILKTILIGSIVAIVCLVINKHLINLFANNFSVVTQYIAPFIEEFLKALFPIYLIIKKKIGFLVDGAIFGFAIGTEFAFIENIYYLHFITDSNLLIWIIRGFGTAFMHGGTTAILAILSIYLCERFNTEKIMIFLPGFLVAYIIHSFFNHFFLSPLLTTVSQLILLPIIMIAVFTQSEKGLQNWLESGLDNDVKILEFIKNGKFKETKPGRYLCSFKTKFPGEVVMDMFCYLRIYLELAIRSKGILLMREAGLETKIDLDIKDKFKELAYLEKSIGKAGKSIILPLLHISKQDIWQLYFLEQQ